MWTASFYIGNFIGPTVSGCLVDVYGFEWTTMVFVAMYIFILVVDICELNYNIWKADIHVSFYKLNKSFGSTNDNKRIEKLSLPDINGIHTQ